MKLLFDFLPIIIFFVIYKIFGIYSATAAAMVIVTAQIAATWLKNRTVEILQLATFAVIIVLGGTTLWNHNPIFIKWKPSIVYWLFAIVFAATQFVGEQPLIQRIFKNNLTLPELVWKRLNILWLLFFISMGFANLYVIYHYSTNTWVNFKLFGALGLTVLFVILQSFYIAKYVAKD